MQNQGLNLGGPAPESKLLANYPMLLPTQARCSSFKTRLRWAQGLYVGPTLPPSNSVPLGGENWGSVVGTTSYKNYDRGSVTCLPELQFLYL